MAELMVDCVMTGAVLLDEAYPGWWDAIDVDTLRMEEYHSCVIGQVAHIDQLARCHEMHESWEAAVRALLPLADRRGIPHPDNPAELAEACGFDLPSADVTFDEADAEQWSMLRDYWVDAINERKRTHGPDTRTA